MRPNKGVWGNHDVKVKMLESGFIKNKKLSLTICLFTWKFKNYNSERQRHCKAAAIV